MQQLHGVGWAIVLFFAVCCALRLARFNTQLEVEQPAYASQYFTGVPAPAAAMLAIMPMFCAFEGRLDRPLAVSGRGLSHRIALLMVSTIPTVS